MAVDETPGDVAVIAVSGEIDISTSPDLWSRIEEVKRVHPRVVLDLAGTTFMDSTGLSLMIRAARHWGPDAVVVRAPQERVRRVFELTGMQELLESVE